MLCTKCNTEAIKNHTLGNEFWYCRTCKEEISVQSGSMTLSEQEMDDLQKQVADCWRAMSSIGGLLREDKPQSLTTSPTILGLSGIIFNTNGEIQKRKGYSTIQFTNIIKETYE